MILALGPLLLSLLQPAVPVGQPSRASRAPEVLRLELPLPGWSAAASTQVVVSSARPDVPAVLRWLGWEWPLWPNEAGRAAAYIALVPGRNDVEVEQTGRGRVASQVLGQLPPPDLIVAAAWEPGSRFDLLVTDPAGEQCDASNRRTQAGGARLRDDPEAPGPHVFDLPRGRAGEYHLAVACGRLPAGRSVRVRAVALLQAGSSAEERREFSVVVTRCDEVTELGTVELLGRPEGQ